MTVLGIQHFNIRASEDEVLTLRDFYCSVLGFTAGPRPPFRSSGFWLYAEGDAVLHLTIAPDAEPLPPTPDRRSAADHIAFRCSGLRSMLMRLDERGVEYSVDSVPLLGQVQVFFRDPSGVGVELNFDSAAEAASSSGAAS